MKPKKKRRRVRTTRKYVFRALFWLTIFIFIISFSFRLYREYRSYTRLEAIYAEQQEQIKKEEQRHQDLKNQTLKPPTYDDIEKIARERLGLVKPGDILLKPVTR